jgi:hypothetical protein
VDLEVVTLAELCNRLCLESQAECRTYAMSIQHSSFQHAQGLSSILPSNDKVPTKSANSCPLAMRLCYSFSLGFAVLLVLAACLNYRVINVDRESRLMIDLR